MGNSLRLPVEQVQGGWQSQAAAAQSQVAKSQRNGHVQRNVAGDTPQQVRLLFEPIRVEVKQGEADASHESEEKLTIRSRGRNAGSI